MTTRPTINRAPVSIRISTEQDPAQSASHRPVRFITTAMPKSGSNWLEAMLFSLPGVGGYGVNSDRACFLTLSMILDTPGLVDALADDASASGGNTPLALERALLRLLDPVHDVGAAISHRRAHQLSPVLDRLAAKVPPRTGLLSPDGVRHVRLLGSAGSIAALLTESREPRKRTMLAAIGCPSKHYPPQSLRTLLPSFRIVQVVRDPRDVLVSRFYHDLGALNPATADLFASRSSPNVPLSPRPDWRTRYFSLRIREMLEYYAIPAPDDRADVDAHTHVVRYESLLTDAATDLSSICSFLGVPFDEHAAVSVIQRFRFDRVAPAVPAPDQPASNVVVVERRGSFLRAGRAGDWRNYFDRSLFDLDLPPELRTAFADLLVRLGYEHDDRWFAALPDSAPKTFDFARLRPRSSLARSFRWIWELDPQLRARYPDPTDVRGDDTFCDHLLRSDHPEVRTHASDLRSLAAHWSANVAETLYF